MSTHQHLNYDWFSRILVKTHACARARAHTHTRTHTHTHTRTHTHTYIYMHWEIEEYIYILLQFLIIHIYIYTYPIIYIYIYIYISNPWWILFILFVKSWIMQAQAFTILTDLDFLQQFLVFKSKSSSRC